jgi:hypothetical protein
MKQLLTTLLAPQRGTAELTATPRWGSAFLLLALTSVALRWIAQPFIVQSTLAHLPPSVTEADKQVVIDNLMMELPATLGFLPIRLLIGWGAFAVVVFFVTRALAPLNKVRFRQIFSLEVHAEATSVIAHAASVVAMVLSPKATIQTTPFSLAQVVNGGSFVVDSLLTSLNIFTLWQVVILTIGLSSISGFRKGKSAVIVLLVWTLSSLFTLGALKLLQDQMRLLL